MWAIREGSGDAVIAVAEREGQFAALRVTGTTLMLELVSAVGQRWSVGLAPEGIALGQGLGAVIALQDDGIVFAFANLLVEEVVQVAAADLHWPQP